MEIDTDAQGSHHSQASQSLEVETPQIHLEVSQAQETSPHQVTLHTLEALQTPEPPREEPETSDMSFNESGNKKLNTSRKQRFRDQWLEDEEFKSWLAAVPGDVFRATCKACNTKLTAGLSELKRHSESSVHRKRMRNFKQIGDICVKIGMSTGASDHGWKPEYERARRFKNIWAKKFIWAKEADDGSGYAYCQMCQCSLYPKVTTLQTHEKSKKHQRNGSNRIFAPSGRFMSTKTEDGEEDHMPSMPLVGMDADDDMDGTSPGSKKFLSPASIGFIGCGEMAQALLSAFLTKGLTDQHMIAVSAPSSRNLAKLPGGIQTTNDNNKVVQESDIIFICVRPESLSMVIEKLEPLERDNNPLFVSIVGGFHIDTLEQMLSTLMDAPRVVRAVLNSPCLIGQGCCVYSMGSNTSIDDSIVVESMLHSIGFCAKVDERQIDAVCGLAGSGPAYIYAAIKALADGGVKMGLSRQLSHSLAAYMVRGAATMVLETGKHPGQLEDEVCAPPGTTITAMHVLERNGFRNTLISAVEASATCSKNLCNQSI